MAYSVFLIEHEEFNDLASVTKKTKNDPKYIIYQLFE